MKETIRNFIQSDIANDNESISYDTPLMSSGIIDSITALQLVSFLEDTFKIEFQPHEVDQENLETIDTIAKFVASKQSGV
ncbi:MAG TPA: acyl carrier protein [Saprospiraceae bacterium]|nr:acyl carrier protein [Saprospiraceae bacterium]HPK10848.1 acyl carrier protein [Saprospiraceae bacterium]HPQ21155.1 acyl carrier protein [Saprospiraceae bacterium]